MTHQRSSKFCTPSSGFREITDDAQNFVNLVPSQYNPPWIPPPVGGRALPIISSRGTPDLSSGVPWVSGGRFPFANPQAIGSGL